MKFWVSEVSIKDYGMKFISRRNKRGEYEA